MEITKILLNGKPLNEFAGYKTGQVVKSRYDIRISEEKVAEILGSNEGIISEWKEYKYIDNNGCLQSGINDLPTCKLTTMQRVKSGYIVDVSKSRSGNITIRIDSAAQNIQKH